jgi:hypothetical protein
MTGMNTHRDALTFFSAYYWMKAITSQNVLFSGRSTRHRTEGYVWEELAAW